MLTLKEAQVYVEARKIAVEIIWCTYSYVVWSWNTLVVWIILLMDWNYLREESVFGKLIWLIKEYEAKLCYEEYKTCASNCEKVWLLEDNRGTIWWQSYMTIRKDPERSELDIMLCR